MHDGNLVCDSDRSREEEERPVLQPASTQDEAEEEGEGEEGEEVEEEGEGSELEEVWSHSPAPASQPQPQAASHPTIPNSLVHPGPQDQANKHGIYVYRE